MRQVMLASVCVGLVAVAPGCDGAGDGGGGAATGTGGAGAAPGDGGPGNAGSCTLAASRLPVSAGRGSTPSIVWTGERYAVAFVDLEGLAGDIHLVTLDEEGGLLSQVVIDDGQQDSVHPSVVLTQGGLVVLWQDVTASGSAVRGRQATLEGEIAGATFTIGQSDAAESWPVGAPSPGGIAVAWMNQDHAALSLAGPDGTVSSTAVIDGGHFASVAGAEGALGLAWSAGDKVGFARPAPDSGTFTPTFHDGAEAKMTNIVLGGADAFVAWEDVRESEQVYVVRVSGDGSMSAEVPVAPEPYSANWPALAWTGTHLAIAYYQFRDSAPAVFVARMTGTPALVDEIQVSGEDAARYPDIVWNGEELGVAYAENGGGVRLSRVRCAP